MSFDDQASKLRQLMQRMRQTRTIALASGKGGVGKSNIALNLSILLSAAGNRVALVDADLGLANLDVLLNVDVHANLSHVISGSRSLTEIVVDLPCGVQFVPGASGIAHLANLSEFQRGQLLGELAALEAENDIIVVDCGAGIGRDVVQLTASADNAMIVTAPEPTAITDAYAVIKVLKRQGYEGKVSLLVNLACDRQEARDTYQRVAGVARQFLAYRVFDAGHVLADPRVSEAVRRREPFVLAYPKCPASRCLAALANRLSAGNELIGQKEGFFKRVANWFA
ncbi:MAG TPA: MinD/ParA family protein [Phycisphaerae bacterium]|nr:MinD/ParA family protein [Phycisphaerae bacterium]